MDPWAWSSIIATVVYSPLHFLPSSPHRRHASPQCSRPSSSTSTTPSPKFDPAREELQQQVCTEYGIQVTQDGIIKGYATADDFMARENGKHHLAKRTEEARKEFFAEYERLILLGAGVDVPAPLAGDIFQKIQTIPYHLALYDDALPCIQTLKSRGAIVGMITNIYADLNRTCARLGLTDCLDFWVTSKEAGSEKPHPAIFEMALSKAGVPAADTVHVGDQYYSDVTGARGVGITPVLIDRAGLSNNMDCTVVQGLCEVPDLLLSLSRFLEPCTSSSPDLQYVQE